MTTTMLSTPASRCRAGFGRCDITPPVGIYHPFWGAATHHRASGVHRPLTATVLVFAPLDQSGGERLQAIVALDHCLLRPADMSRLSEQTGRLVGLDADSLTFTFSHTHSGGHIARSRSELPGGDKIAPYLDELPEKIAAAFQTAKESLEPTVLTYASTRCSMGHDRDFWDADIQRFVCGFNLKGETHLPLHVVRMTDRENRLRASIINYPCHPTTLAWQNTLISPDYVGALRDVVEQATGAPCFFLLAPCGDVGPRNGYVGDVAIADQNGRQVAYAALSALEAMPPPLCDYHYAGHVVSGATLGTWEYRPFSEERMSQTAVFRQRHWTVPLAYRRDIPTFADAEHELARFLKAQTEAGQRGDGVKAREAGAMAERQRRLLERIRPLPEGRWYPYAVGVRQWGDAFWISVEGEPYHALERSLAERFPNRALIFATLANGARASYLPAQEDYGKALYQVEIAIVEAGSLETVTAEIGTQIKQWHESTTL